MNVNSVRVAQGGLMRCCIQTFKDLPDGFDFTEGQVLDCKFERPGNAKMIFEGGTLRWNHPRDERENGGGK